MTPRPLSRSWCEQRFEQWLAQQRTAGVAFTPRAGVAGADPRPRRGQHGDRDGRLRLCAVRAEGRRGKAYQVFGERLEPLLDELNEVLAA